MCSQEGEEIEIKSVLIEAKIEAWLKKLIEAMKEALRKIFYTFYTQKMNS